MRLSTGQYPRTYFFAMHPFSLRPRKTGLSNRPCDIFFIVKLSLSPTSTLATRAQSNNLRLSLPGLVQSLQLTGVSSLLNVLAVKAYGEAEFWLSGTCRQMVSRTWSSTLQSSYCGSHLSKVPVISASGSMFGLERLSGVMRRCARCFCNATAVDAKASRL